MREGTKNQAKETQHPESMLLGLGIGEIFSILVSPDLFEFLNGLGTQVHPLKIEEKVVLPQAGRDAEPGKLSSLLVAQPKPLR